MFSPDGKAIVSTRDEGHIGLWNFDSRTFLRSFAGHSKNVNSIAFSPDGKHLLSGDEEGILKLWNVDTGEALRSFTHPSKRLPSITSVAFSRDGQRFVAATLESIVAWDFTTGRQVRNIDDGAWSVAFSPDGQHLLIGGDRDMGLWNIEAHRYERFFEGHTRRVPSIAFSPDGRQILSGSHDRTVKLWDVSGKLLRSFEGHSARVDTVAFAPNGQRAVSGSDDGTIKIWNLEIGGLAATMLLQGVDWLTITPEGFFDISPNAHDLLNVVRGLEIMGIDQVYQVPA